MSFEPEGHRSTAISIIELRDPASFPPAAVELVKRTLDAFESLNGPEHPKTVEMRRELAMVLRGRGQVAEALPLLERVLTQQERSLGPSAYQSLAGRYELALAFRDAGNPDRAMALLAGTVDEVGRVFGAAHELTIASRHLYTELLESQAG